MLLVEFIVKGLATWRVSHMLVKEDGPWYAFRRLRESQGWEYDEDGNIIVYPDSHVLACVWCLSVWVGLLFSRLPISVVIPFALSAVAILTEKWLDD